MEGLKDIAGYQGLKQALDTELKKAKEHFVWIAEDFVRIGYLLRRVEDTGVRHELGYHSIQKFGEGELGLTPDVVSRYININKRYSEGGYSECLQVKYQDYGVAKLAEMLTLSDEAIESMDPELSRKEIQEVKREIREEKQITDVEVILEGEKKEQQAMDSLLMKALHQYCYENREAYVKLYDAVMDTVYDGTNIPVVEKILDAMAPSGIAMKMVRIQGVGKLMISIRGKEKDVEVLNVRTDEKEVHTWDRVIGCLESLCTDAGAKKSWEEIYGEPFRIRETKEQSKTMPVQKSVEPENPEEQIHGQMDVCDYPKMLPEGMEVPQKEPGNTKASEKVPEPGQLETIENPEAIEEPKQPEVAPVQQSREARMDREESKQEIPAQPDQEIVEQRTEGQMQQDREKIQDIMTELSHFLQMGEYVSAKKTCQTLLWYLDREVSGI